MWDVCVGFFAFSSHHFFSWLSPAPAPACRPSSHKAAKCIQQMPSVVAVLLLLAASSVAALSVDEYVSRRPLALTRGLASTSSLRFSLLTIHVHVRRCFASFAQPVCLGTEDRARQADEAVEGPRHERALPRAAPAPAHEHHADCAGPAHAARAAPMWWLTCNARHRSKPLVRRRPPSAHAIRRRGTRAPSMPPDVLFAC